MKQRILLAIMILLMCAVTLAGCGAKEELPQFTRPADIRPLPSNNPGSSLIDYDSNRQIYIGTENIYMDYYMGITGAPYLDIPVYSKLSLGTDEHGGLGHFIIDLCWSPDIELSIEQCWAEVTQAEVQRKTEFMASKEDAPENIMPYYVYQAYRGEAAHALADTRVNYVLRAGMTDPLRADFEALTAEDLPEFYVYNLRIRFEDMPVPDAGDPWVLEKLKLTVDGKTYEGTFGGVRIFNPADCPDPLPVRITPEYADTYMGAFSELYSDGIVKVLQIPVINRMNLAKDCTGDLELTESQYAWMCDVWTLDAGSEVLAAYATVKDRDGTSHTFRVGDHDNSKTVYPGDSLYVDVVLKNKDAGKLLSNHHFQIVVWWAHHAIFQGPDGPLLTGCDHVDAYTVVSTTNTNHYENYAILFDGVDMEPYYDYYFENYESWRKDYLD